MLTHAGCGSKVARGLPSASSLGHAPCPSLLPQPWSRDPKGREPHPVPRPRPAPPWAGRGNASCLTHAAFPRYPRPPSSSKAASVLAVGGGIPPADALSLRHAACLRDAAPLPRRADSRGRGGRSTPRAVARHPCPGSVLGIPAQQRRRSGRPHPYRRSAAPTLGGVGASDPGSHRGVPASTPRYLTHVRDLSPATPRVMIALYSGTP